MPDAPVKIFEFDGRAVLSLKAWSGALNPVTSLVPAGMGGHMHIVPLAPAEWLATSDSFGGAELRELLVLHTNDEIAVTDLSCAFKVVRVEGTASRVLLAKGCGLDLHPDTFPAGRAARTRLAQLAVIVNCVDPSPQFDLYVGRSYRPWLMSWLADSTSEFE
jgi:sarcosine oxidase subunit gamma